MQQQPLIPKHRWCLHYVSTTQDKPNWQQPPKTVTLGRDYIEWKKSMELFPSEVGARRASVNDTTLLFIMCIDRLLPASFFAAVPLVLSMGIQIETRNVTDNQQNSLHCINTAVYCKCSQNIFPICMNGASSGF